MSQTVRAEKVDKKMELFVLFPCSLPELWSLNCLNSARNLSLLIKSVYIYASDRSRYTLSEIGNAN